MNVPDGPYLVYSLGIGTNVFADEFSVLWVSQTNNKLGIQIKSGSLDLLKNGDVWSGTSDNDTYTIKARQGNIRSNNMLIGKATRQPSGQVSSFVAIELREDFSPILIDDAATDYAIYFQDNTDGTLKVEKDTTGNKLKFEFPSHDGNTKNATTLAGQSPGRFNAVKDSTSDHDIYGFVLPHRLWENNQPYRVLVGHAVKTSLHLPGSDDIDPYVAVATSSGV